MRSPVHSSQQTQPMSVNVALCGSIPRSIMVQEQQQEQQPPQLLSLPSHNTSLGAPCLITSLTSRLSKDGLAENNRCGSDGSTHLSKNNRNNTQQQSQNRNQRENPTIVRCQGLTILVGNHSAGSITLTGMRRTNWWRWRPALLRRQRRWIFFAHSLLTSLILSFQGLSEGPIPAR